MENLLLPQECVQQIYVFVNYACTTCIYMVTKCVMYLELPSNVSNNYTERNAVQ